MNHNTCGGFAPTMKFWKWLNKLIYGSMCGEGLKRAKVAWRNPQGKSFGKARLVGDFHEPPDF